MKVRRVMSKIKCAKCKLDEIDPPRNAKWRIMPVSGLGMECNPINVCSRHLLAVVCWLRNTDCNRMIVEPVEAEK